MSSDVGPQPDLVQETQRQILRMNRLVQEIAQLAEQEVPAETFFGELLQNVLTAILAPAGAVWLCGPQGQIQLQYQINFHQVGIEQTDEARQSHAALLRLVWQQGQSRSLHPRSGAGGSPGDSPAAANPTDFVLLLVPIRVHDQGVGLIEVFQHTSFHAEHHAGLLQFLERIAGLASTYLRNQQLRRMVGEQQVWTQMEAFACRIHGSLSPTEVAYLVANEGRRLIGCDRLSVAQSMGRRLAILAISGADVIDKRSNLVRLLRVLCGRVLNWRERLVYRGTRDESLPPQVLRALDAYLAESDSKLLVVIPVSDERERDQKRRPRSALVLESFEPDAGAGKLVDRLEVIGRHAASALYNAAEHGGIPLRWVWRPLALVQQGLGGRARALALAIAAALLAVVAALAVPPQVLSLPGQVLKMDARGQLLPKERRWLFSPVDAEVVRLDVPEDRVVRADQSLMLLYFDAPLQQKLAQLQAEIEGIDKTITALDAEFALAASPAERLKISTDKTREVANRQLKGLELLTLRRQTQAQWLPQEARPGWYFWLLSPLNGTVLNADYQENLTNRYVKPAEPLLRVGNTAGPWEVELRIPQSHIGQVLKAMHAEEEQARAEGRPAGPLDVDLMLMSAPTRCFRGKLPRDRIAPQASSNRDDNNETEPVVLTWVRLDGDDIPIEERVPRDLFLSGTEVHARIRCGEHPLGYTLFYGLWEFFYEKVVFLF